MATGACFHPAPQRSGVWLIAMHAAAGHVVLLIPPGTLCPAPDRGPRLHWARCVATQLDADDTHVASDPPAAVTVAEAMRHARRSGCPERWVLQRSLLFAQHLLAMAEQCVRPHEDEIACAQTSAAVELLEQVAAATDRELPDEVAQLAADALPALATTLLEPEPHAPPGMIFA